MRSKSPLVPEREPKSVDYEMWRQHKSEEQKWELWHGVPFAADGSERDRLAVCLLFSMGLEHLVREVLPESSKKELLQLLLQAEENN